MAHRALDLRSSCVIPLGGLIVELHRREVRVDSARCRHAHRSAVIQIAAKKGKHPFLVDITTSLGISLMIMWAIKTHLMC